MHDILFFCSFWLFGVYSLFDFAYGYTIRMLKTLSKLFRGRKYNVIRKRDDSHAFHLVELYLGVLIVSISLFLLPTLAIFYYYAFISIILSVLALQVILLLSQVLVTNFPYFLLAWSLAAPYSLPNRIRVDA